MKISKTVSTWTPQTEQGSHVFRISGYNSFAVHETGLSSEKFSVGGCDWSIFIIPDMTFGKDDHAFWRDHVRVGLWFQGKYKVRAAFEFRLVDQNRGASVCVYKKLPHMFDPDNKIQYTPCSIKKDLLKGWTTDDDCLTIECTVTVYKKPLTTQTKSFPRIEVPQSDIAEQFCKLLETKDGADTTFIVGGETFTAHKIVLATRSPVFRAELFGPLSKDGTEPITIKDLQPVVFRSLLHFIYTDSLPSMDDLKGSARCEMIRHLLVAADRYALERLNLMCQSMLCEDLQVQNVATTLGLADQHGCGMLKDACIEFITSSNALEAVAATKDYKNLKRSCPSVVIEALEKASKTRRE